MRKKKKVHQWLEIMKKKTWNRDEMRVGELVLVHM